MTMLDPWFSHWNHRCFEILFRYIPHSQNTDDRFGDLISNPLWGTWFFAAVCYRFWAVDDELQLERRWYAFRTLVAIAAAVFVTALIRPFVGWPAPVINSGFQGLFPHYLWGEGRWNCFPSHSTLAYFTLSAGFWPVNRRAGILMSLLALALVSFPRVYLGGHYPVDVLFSCVLGVAALVGISRWKRPAAISEWLVRRGQGTMLRDILLFLWLFELGEGFRGTEFVVAAIRRVALSR